MPLTKTQIIQSLNAIIEENAKTTEYVKQILTDLTNKKPKKEIKPCLCVRCGRNDSQTKFKPRLKSKCAQCINLESNQRLKQKNYFNEYWKINTKDILEKRKIWYQKRKLQKQNEQNQELNSIIAEIEEQIDNITDSEIESDAIEVWCITNDNNKTNEDEKHMEI